MQIMTSENRNSTDFLWYRHFLPVKFFSLVLLLYTMFRATAKCNVDRWIKCVISTSTGISGVRLAHRISKREWWPIIFIVIFETGKVSKNFIGNFYFWGIASRVSFCFFCDGNLWCKFQEHCFNISRDIVYSVFTTFQLQYYDHWSNLHNKKHQYL